ncbi:MAG: hypothetical protein ACLFQ3_02575 [Thiohalorhabdus sp.]
MGTVVEGPWTQGWRCPTCARPAPLFLPNGGWNRACMRPAEYVLDDPWVLAESERQMERTELAEVEVCLSCRDSIPYLVGSLVVPYGEQGVVQSGAGRADTQIVGGILPTSSANRSGIVLFFGDAGNGLYLADRQALAAFTTGRLTSPDRRGDIPERLWRLYGDRLQWLQRQRSDPGEP